MGLKFKSHQLQSVHQLDIPQVQPIDSRTDRLTDKETYGAYIIYKCGLMCCEKIVCGPE